ncbi:MAG: hypothetical protein KDJ99_34355 [Candidatus Competibacteraceae bacterium]|nr:hypothetical protein [Candidatus Competibacteraceae bacterium]
MSNTERPKGLILDLDYADSLLRQAATMMALDINTSSRWQKDDSWNGWALGWLGSANPVKMVYNLCAHGQWATEGPGAQVVDTNYQKFARDRLEFLALFQNNLIRLACTNPPLAWHYLQEKRDHALRSWRNIQATFNEARSVNKQVCRTINDALDNTYRIQVASKVGVCVLGSFVAAPWYVVAAGQMAHSVICDMIWQPGEVRRAKIVGFHAKDASATVDGEVHFNRPGLQYGLGQVATAGLGDKQHGFVNGSFTSNGLQHALNYSLRYKAEAAAKQMSQKYLATLEKRSMIDVAQRMAGNRAYKAVGTHGLSKNSWAKVSRLAEKTTQLEGHAARVSAKAHMAAGSAAAAVGVFFMRDEIFRAFSGYTAGTDRNR